MNDSRKALQVLNRLRREAMEWSQRLTQRKCEMAVKHAAKKPRIKKDEIEYDNGGTELMESELAAIWEVYEFALERFIERLDHAEKT